MGQVGGLGRTSGGGGTVMVGLWGCPLRLGPSYGLGLL